MAHSTRLGFAFLFVSSLALGCAVAIDDTTRPASGVVIEDTAASDAVPLPEERQEADGSASKVIGEPVYFGYDNGLSAPPDKEKAPSYTFELVADANITIHLARRDESGPRNIGFSLSRISGEGQYTELGETRGSEGYASMTLYTVHGGFYAIRLADGITSKSLVLSLECNSGVCAVARQPGQSCGSAAGMQCDKGLGCFLADEACGKVEHGSGRCEVIPQECPAVYSPVCGCDGTTWGNECFAKQEGVSILSTGECDTD